MSHSSILLIDTSASRCAVGLAAEGLHQRFGAEERKSAQNLLPLVAEITQSANIALKDLTAIAVMAGPGSFTGLRIGVGVAQALAMANRTPGIVLSNLAVLALAAAEARAKAIAALEAVQIRDPERVMDSYPHELSGGMGQRVMIAMMLIPDPDLLIADEPTSALDVTVQAEVLSILDDLVKTRGMGLIFISHDLRLVARFCDRVLVMYKGKIVEELAAKDLLQA